MQHLDQNTDRLELELFWPQSSSERKNIAQILRQCFGMTAAYLTSDQTLYHIRNQKHLEMLARYFTSLVSLEFTVGEI